jgi:hypothetical protein
MEGSRRSGRRGRRPSELLACGCAAADANWAARPSRGGRCKCLLISAQNASCKLGVERKIVAASREECSDALHGWCLEACGI